MFEPHDMEWEFVHFYELDYLFDLRVDPIQVSPIGLTGFYRVEDGRHRATALYQLDYTHADCILVPYGSGFDPWFVP